MGRYIHLSDKALVFVRDDAQKVVVKGQEGRVVALVRLQPQKDAPPSRNVEAAVVVSAAIDVGIADDVPGEGVVDHVPDAFFAGPHELHHAGKQQKQVLFRLSLRLLHDGLTAAEAENLTLHEPDELRRLVSSDTPEKWSAKRVI